MEFCKTAFLFLFFFFIEAHAHFNFQTFQNRNSPNFTFLDSVRDSSQSELNPFYNSAIYQYEYHPIDYEQGDDGQGALVSSIQNLNFASEYSGWKRFSLGFEMSLHQINYHNQGIKFAFGDTRIFSKIKLIDSDFSEGLKIAFIPSVYLPTGNRELLLSNSKGGAGGNLAAEKR